jgi:hypothetical protein
VVNRPLALQVAPNVSTVQVGLPPHELATEQVHAEEKQRLLGIFPNFYVSYDRNAAPLTAAQKFQLGLRTIIDLEVILGNAASAGIEQWHNNERQWGQVITRSSNARLTVSVPLIPVLDLLR